jgi:glutamyl-tRNA synthetase
MNTETVQVVTRVAPSPTGRFHIGTARTALFNYLFARHYGGKFLLRIEDTDSDRSKKEYEEDILQGMTLLGLAHDGLYRQSEHVARHVTLLHKLVHEDKAYISREPMKSDSSKEVEVVRLRNQGKVVTFRDEIRGDITFDTTELGDMVIARSIRDPLYHFAVVVDDADEGVTHVIRGEDHISNTPRQILLQEALGLARPVYAHLPLILAPDKSKMSKRKGAVAVSEYIAEGFYPEALVNYFALLGWNPGTQQEIFTLPELVEAFTLEGVQKGGAIFNKERLEWVQREHRGVRSEESVHEEIITAFATHDIVDVLRRSHAARTDMLERYATTDAMKKVVEQEEYLFYTHAPAVSAVMLMPKKGATAEETVTRLETVASMLRDVHEQHWNAIVVKGAVWEFAEQEGKGLVLWPLRVALSGRERSPDPFTIAEAIGKNETVRRIAVAVDALVKVT